MENNRIINSFKFEWNNTLIELLPDRAIFIPKTKELLISDIHLGKGEFFQLNGIPLTNNHDEYNFNRIYKLINKIKPKKIIIIGDLFHSRYSISNNLKSKVLNIEKYFKIQLLLIEGNHDKGCNINSLSSLKVMRSINLIYSHEPIINKEKNILNICGHYHPKVLLKNSLDKLSFKCFAMDKKNNILYLPAFGDLTGGYFCKKDFKKWAIISDESLVEL